VEGGFEMGTTTNVSIRMDTELKKEAESLFADLGLNMSSALTIFLKQAVRAQGIPFEVTRIPNAETIAAMKEAERIAHDSDVKGYTDLDQLFKDLKA
jgi:DNA-damage-inducible protein J